MLLRRSIAALCALALLAGCSPDTVEPAPSGESVDGANPVHSEPDPGARAEAPSPTPGGEPLEEALPEEPPAYPWEVDLPEHHGVDAALLESMHAALADTAIFSVVTVKDGVIIDEFYNEGYDETSTFRLASCSKSVTGALVGIAIDEGLIEGVDVSIAEYFPQVAGTDKEEITIRHLLEHTSGIEWYQWAGGTTGREMRESDQWVDFVLNRQMAYPPGSTFSYTNGGPYLLSVILQQATGMTALDYATRRLFEPMGIRDVEWETSPQDITNGASGLWLSARDAAKFGQLYLNGGSWEGAQLVPAQWVEQSTQVQVARYDRSGSYGYQWWVQSFGAAGYDTFYAMGSGGQFIFVVPELALVTVITSRLEDTYAPWPYFTDYILEACA